MANVIKHKRGSGSDPGASDLIIGELAIRTDTGKLFTKMDSGAIAEIAGGGSDIAINTLSSSSGTGGGSATFNGSAYRFTLSAPPNVSAAQLLVSINGVIQKPVAGTGQPSEGFSVDGTDIILGDAPATGSDFFILTFKSLGVSEPADNSVTSAKIVDGAIVNADINASAAIAGSKIAPIFTSATEVQNSTFKITDSNPEILLAVPSGGLDSRIINDGSGNLIIGHGVNSDTPTERLRIDSDGDVLVGLTTALSTQAGSIQAAGPILAKSYINSHTSNATVIEYISNVSKIRAYGATSGSGILAFNTGGGGGSTDAERMRIDSSGRVGINDTTPDADLSVSNSNSSQDAAFVDIGKAGGNRFKLGYEGNNCFLGASSSSGMIIFKNNVNSDGNPQASGTEHMRINSSGVVSIGTTSPNASADKLHVEDSGENNVYFVGNSSTLGARLILQNKNSTANAFSMVQGADASGQGVANIKFHSASDANNEGFMSFETRPSGGTATRVMLLTSNGNVSINNLCVAGSGFAQQDSSAHLISTSSVGSSSQTYFIGNQAIQTSSDRRIKENIINTEIDALSKLEKVKVVDFNWNDPSDKAINNKNARGKWTGCIAQEIVDIFPHVVNAPRPQGKEIDYNSEDLWTIQYEHLVPVLIKAIQELTAKVEALEAK